jgi:hypothetical protein
MPDRHLLFCLTCPHGVLTMMASTHDLLKLHAKLKAAKNQRVVETQAHRCAAIK